MKFENFGLSQELLKTIKGMGFEEPTQIQNNSIKQIVDGRDLIGESATGSGKTLVFGCGIVEHVMPNQGLQALVLTPTRELTEQVKESLRKLSHYKKLKVAAIYGGVAIGPQIDLLKRAEVIVATPGRMLDHLGRRTVDLSKIKILVLDEADRMFDMGFIEDVEQIIRNCPKKRQTMFFSATISSRVKDLAHKHMVNPAQAMVRNLVDPSKLKQVYYNVSRNMKLSLLVHLLEHEKSGLVMVFCNTRNTVDFVVRNLKANRINAIAIHGGLSQNKRTKTIELFNGSKVSVLVCTDVAARGLHIENVSHIYNYDIPKDPKDYVHRIGRTARAGESGKAVNLLCEMDYDNFSRILSDYRTFNIEKVEKPQLERRIFIKTEEPRRGFRRGGFSGNQRQRTFGERRSPDNRRRRSKFD